MARGSSAAHPVESRMQDPESSSGASPSSAQPRKKRQKRTVYSIEQRLQLEEFFQMNRYGSYDECKTLANKLNLQDQQVQVWLKNRRAKDRKLQKLRQQQGPGAHAVPQGKGICEVAPWPGPGCPTFQGDPELSSTPVFPEEQVFTPNPMLPAGPLNYRSPGFCSLPPSKALQVVPEADACDFSYSQACWHPEQSYQGMVLAAPVPAPAPAPAQAGVLPQSPYTFSFSPDPVVTPGVTELHSSKGSFSSCQPSAENGEESYMLLDL